jgi:hypothetical protein
LKPARTEISAEKVSFGYRRVSPSDKKRPVRTQFDPIARTYDLADALQCKERLMILEFSMPPAEVINIARRNAASQTLLRRRERAAGSSLNLLFQLLDHFFHGTNVGTVGLKD